jgi:SAM-dependent methyltransferase
MNKAPHLSREELKSLAANVSKLSSLLTKDRESLPAAYLRDAGLRSAYVRYYLPTNMQKVHLALTDLSLHAERLLSKDRLRVLDLGAGPGTALLGLLAFFDQRPQPPALACVAVDRVAENLRLAEELFAAYRTNNLIDASLKTIRADVEGVAGLFGGFFDLIILSNGRACEDAPRPVPRGKRELHRHRAGLAGDLAGIATGEGRAPGEGGFRIRAVPHGEKLSRAHEP